ncbi:sulfite exporter TauE/SafE family protein [Legionella yabuuchiae]|uniref:sulfite exporter TauE/SafE family protein n=1 Tax=Legionella yabuuchiae TaxID=376727 RepID=UPI001055BD72|nr:sulfite exporter TauE/SafE family protein [Legionella yabuuchiae]
MYVLYSIFALTGLLNGFLNTIASSGSAVTLPLLIFLGMTPEIANGTNRVPVLLGSIVAIFLFSKLVKIPWSIAIKIVIPVSIGSLLGAIIAEIISAGDLGILITIAVLIALILLFTRIKQELLKTFTETPRVRWQEVLIFFVIGIWLGFIVLDGATYLLLALILAVRLPFVEATAIKNLCIATSTIVSLAFFSIKGSVDWGVGSIMAFGSLFGGFLGTKAAMHPMAKTWAYWLLVIIILLELSHMGIRYYHLFTMR